VDGASAAAVAAAIAAVVSAQCQCFAAPSVSTPNPKLSILHLKS
jgi:hypothetical protein